MDINLDECWFDFVESEIDFGDDDLGDPVELPPDDLPPAPTNISCEMVHPLLDLFSEQLVNHQLQGGQPEDHLDPIRLQVATCAASELANAHMLLAGGVSPRATVKLTLDDLRFMIYSNLIFAFGAADYVEQHFDG